GAGGELELQEFGASARTDSPLGQPRRQQCPGLGSEREKWSFLHIVKRFDPKWVAGQNQLAGSRIVDRDGVHAAEFLDKLKTFAPIEMQGRLAIRSGAKAHLAELLAQLGIIVNLAIGDQYRAVVFV